MLPPCFGLSDRVFPLVRHHAARLMAEEGLTQVEIGKRLGVSQAMVSKYLKVEPAEPTPQDAWIVEEMAQQVATALDDRIAGAPEAGQPNPWCRTFAQTIGPGTSPRRQLVAETARILSQLDGAPVGGLVPAVNVNIAAALPDAAGREDVAAFPGRLALVRGKLRAHGPPEFGASQHLAAVLARARDGVPDVRFVANVRADDAVRRALHKLDEQAVEASSDDRDEAGVPGFTLAGNVRTVIDRGGFGIEPATYLFDTTGDALAGRMVRLARALA